jgi:hypothetical protein
MMFLLRLFVLSYFLGFSIHSYCSTEAEHRPLLNYGSFNFTFNGRPIVNISDGAGQNRIEKWHEYASSVIRGFASNIFGRMQGNNWAMASVGVLYETEEGIACSDILPFPHIFTSGEKKALPSPSKEGEKAKLEAIDPILKEHPLYFVTTEFDSPEDKKMDRFIVERMMPFILRNVHAFITPHRSEGKIREAFGAYTGGSGDKNLARNWFTDSEQGILLYLNNHSEELIRRILPEGRRPLAFILNIVTLNDMCGMCYRSVELTKMLNLSEHENPPIFSFVTGLRIYGAGAQNSRSHLVPGGDINLIVGEARSVDSLFVRYAEFGK